MVHANRRIITMGFGSLGAVGGATASSPVTLLDLVPVRSLADTAYGLIKLRSAYIGNCVEMRNEQSGTYVSKQIGFSKIGQRWIVNVAAGNAFDALRDPGTLTEVRFLDQTGNGNDSTISGSHIGFYWGSDVYGNPTLRSVHSATNVGNSSQALTMPSRVALNNDAYSAIFVGLVDSSWPQDAIHIYELINPRTRFFAYASGGGYGFAFGNSGSFAYGSRRAGPGFFANVISQNQIQTVFNDNSIVNIKPLQSATSTGANLGWSTNGITVSGGADYLAMIFYDRTLTSVELALARTWAYQNYNTVVDQPAASNLIVVGESVGEGYNTNSNQCFPQLMLSLLKKQVNLYVVSTGGYSYSNWSSNLNAVTRLLQPGVENVIALFGCCWNEIIQGATPTQAYVNMQNLITSWRNAASSIGASLKVIGTGQAQIANSALATATQNSFSTILQAGHLVLDGFYDLSSDPNIGNAANVNNPVYYSGDGVHLTAPIAHQIVAEGLAAAFNAVAA
jgi:hypothetical protein